MPFEQLGIDRRRDMWELPLKGCFLLGFAGQVAFLAQLLIVGGSLDESEFSFFLLSLGVLDQPGKYIVQLLRVFHSQVLLLN